MRRSVGIAFSVLLAGIVVGTAGCTPPMPPDVLSARAEQYIECQSGNQDISIDEQYAAAIDAVSSVLNTSCPDQTMTAVSRQSDATASNSYQSRGNWLKND